MTTSDFPIRILNLFTIMNRGGAETMVMNYYRNIDRTKIQFDFMVHRQERGAYDDEIEKMGGRIYRMPVIRPWSSREYRKCIRDFYKEHPEYRIIHSHMSELGYYDFMEASKTGVPIRICHAHNRPYGIDLKSFFRWYYKKRMMPYLTHMFMCGEEAGEWLFGTKNKNNCIPMNNAIDCREYRFDEKVRLKKRQELDVEGKVVVGHVGRFNYQKNHPFIIEVFKAVCMREQNAVLLLVGDGEDRTKIEEKVNQYGIKDKVFFLGTRADVSELLQAMDVFVFPSFFEGLSVASIEAQAAGVPILISDKIPIECKKTELVEMLSLKCTADVWAEKLLSMAKTERKDTYDEIRKSGFDIKENAKKLQAFYLEVASGKEKQCLL